MRPCRKALAPGCYASNAFYVPLGPKLKITAGKRKAIAVLTDEKCGSCRVVSLSLLALAIEG
jgi:hypothetical protein